MIQLVGRILGVIGPIVGLVVIALLTEVPAQVNLLMMSSRRVLAIVAPTSILLSPSFMS